MLTVKLQKSENDKKQTKNLYILLINYFQKTLEEISELPKTAAQLLKVACLKSDVN